ncbi:uncharacterized protein SPPG_02038 [Spizellomyces punctatus DAOM BR117]|uniref:Uncharacterized protein n=1 Tax=Spizellomyces punctatus (strain DAOM BR117) TaxID=645134 RepID=A0A0L0HPE4_SPIPD|nr:uncharacterized protein SPPG_02038 [Spizellomyces punctatus DAOM BR117]KND02962.1 hypothetical protein SPPG_02038 [Spizellomyces punctatus DAOM BR117]|eukprot:XP_016611001.1 hypothetical protein SPPG_02038 [Spizellomyces punctatus DAOM BR117]
MTDLQRPGTSEPPNRTNPLSSAQSTRNAAQKPSPKQYLAPLPNSTSPSSSPDRRTPQPPPTKLAQTISNLTERTRAARESLEKMTQLTAQLREQCNLQDAECAALETEKTRAKEELEGMIKRVEELVKEKVKVEHRLEELRGENDRLESFLAESETVAKSTATFLKPKTSHQKQLS